MGCRYSVVDIPLLQAFADKLADFYYNANRIDEVALRLRRRRNSPWPLDNTFGAKSRLQAFLIYDNMEHDTKSSASQAKTDDSPGKSGSQHICILQTEDRPFECSVSFPGEQLAAVCTNSFKYQDEWIFLRFYYGLSQDVLPV